MKLLALTLRVGLLLMGLVFVVFILALACALALIWLLRALWAKLSGQPVSPWTFKMHRQQAWQRFYRGGFGTPKPAPSGRTDDVVDVPASDANNVTDVEIKRITPAD